VSFTDSHFAEYQYAGFHHAECHLAECHLAECHGGKNLWKLLKVSQGKFFKIPRNPLG
jgi:hypothetical protein